MCAAPLKPDMIASAVAAFAATEGAQRNIGLCEITDDGQVYLVSVPDEWVAENPLWWLLAPGMVERAKKRLAGKLPL